MHLGNFLQCLVPKLTKPEEKKRFVAHPRQTISSIKTTELQIYVLSEPAAPNTPKLTPSSSEELILAHAGLGKRLITFNEIAKHDEVR